MAKCKNCGAELSDNSRICYSCKYEAPLSNTIDNNCDRKQNKIGNLLRLIGKILLVLGIVGAIGFELVFCKATPLLGFVYGVGILFSTLVSASVFLGFSEIIFLLEDIKNK